MRHLSRFVPVLMLMLCAAVVSVAAAQPESKPVSVQIEAIGVEPQPVEELPEVGQEPATEAEEPIVGEIDAPATEVPEEIAPTEEAGPEELPEPLEVPAPIVAVEVVGNSEIPTEDVLKVIKSAEGGQFSKDQVARDRQAVLNLGWFQTVSVERESVENGIRLVFRVRENPVVSDIVFEGSQELTKDELLAVMKTAPGQVYSAPQLARDAQAVEELYRSQGYILAIVVGQRMSDDGILTLVIAEGVIEDITITGNTRTKTYAIRRYMKTQVGETYNDRKVSRDVAKLSSLGWFETVRRDAEVGTEPGKVILIITVVEKRRTGMASVGGGYSSVQGLVGFVDLTKSNIGGNGQVVSIRGEFGGRTSYELGYQHPWIMTPETRLNAGLYDRLILREAIVQDDEGENRSVLYDERRNGANVTFGRPLSDVTTVFFGLKSDDVSIEGVSEEEAEFLTGEAFEPRKVRSITLAAVNDTRSDVYNPRGGAYQRLSAEFAGVIFGGSEFNKYVLDTRRFFKTGSKNAIGLRFLVGAVSGDVPYLEQFLIGGSETLRGYRTDRFVGTRMAILNAEYRMPISDNLLGVLFVDVGDAWGGPLADDPSFEDSVHDSFTSHVGYGLGVRVKTPIGPIRLDLGFSEEGTETHFGVRNMF
ncbi:MAG: BamA/TamA family outer membrane protein [Armatimonadetes bacterium]|nr:BamA/TamA family outer membrane protein [Armatimonadota bacterium]